MSEVVKLCCEAEEGVSLRKVTIIEDRLRLISLILRYRTSVVQVVQIKRVRYPASVRTLTPF